MLSEPIYGIVVNTRQTKGKEVGAMSEKKARILDFVGIAAAVSALVCIFAGLVVASIFASPWDFILNF